MSGMEYAAFQCEQAPAAVEAARFRGASGVAEHHLVIRPTRYGSIAEQLGWVSAAWRGALAALGVDSATAVFRRFFCSDLVNQAPALADEPLARRDARAAPCAVSWVDQPPEPPARVVLWAYHVSDPAAAPDKRLDGATLTWQRDGLAHCWTTGLACPGAGGGYRQMRSALEQYAALLRERRLSLAGNVIRTWLFIRDIDARYAEVAAARRACFRAHGLTPETHFIASTGIEGGGADPATLVTLDAYAIAGVQPGQITFLAAPQHLCPAHRYGATFERGTAVTYRDRRHVFISGTASIDAEGALVHPGDATRQLDRALENVAALLGSAGASFADLGVLIAYVRDPSDQARVRERLRARAPGVPGAVLVAAICRPGWLVEVEAVALLPAERPELPAF